LRAENGFHGHTRFSDAQRTLTGFMPDLKPGYNLIRMLAPHGEEAGLRRLEP
jgi:hypothetical protein